jgi:hypothetical protein
MTRDQIIAMAQQAGLCNSLGGIEGDSGCFYSYAEEIERFAALIAAHERAKAAALLAEDKGEPLSFEQVEDCFPDGSDTDENGRCVCSAQWLHDFAQEVHRRYSSLSAAGEPVACVVTRRAPDGSMRTAPEFFNGKHQPAGTVLYTRPQPALAPLTEEQMTLMWINAGEPCSWPDFVAHVRRTETAHGIKGKA